MIVAAALRNFVLELRRCVVAHGARHNTEPTMFATMLVS